MCNHGISKPSTIKYYFKNRNTTLDFCRVFICRNLSERKFHSRKEAIMDIPRRVRNLIKKYKTRNPYELASHLNIHIVFQPMHHSVHGFFDRVLRRKFIVINSTLPEHLQRQTCAHELGHALMHKGWGYYFMLSIPSSPPDALSVKQMSLPGYFFLTKKIANIHTAEI